MRLVFAGTPAAAVPSLRRLIDAHHAGRHELVGVVTRPPAPLGRKRVLTPSPVAECAAASLPGVPLIETARLDEAAGNEIEALAPELGVIVAYGGLVRERLLAAPTHGWINLHFSLLPRWRGAAPVQHALMAGDAELGVSVFQLVTALDAGELFAREALPVAADATAGEVLEGFAAEGALVLERVIDQIATGTAVREPQRGESSYAGKLDARDGLLDFTRPAPEVLARYRGVTPEPGAHTSIGEQRLKVLQARRSGLGERVAPGEVRLAQGAVLVGTASAPLELVRVQPAGKAAMSAADWWRGLRLETLQTDAVASPPEHDSDEGAHA